MNSYYYNYPNYYGNYKNYTSHNANGDRFFGALAAPFLLGGLAGAAIAPAFYRPYPYYPP